MNQKFQFVTHLLIIFEVSIKHQRDIQIEYNISIMRNFKEWDE